MEAAQESGRVLVVDDDRQMRDFCKRSLERPGVAVETADSSQEALERLAEAPFDLVVSDMRMDAPDSGVALAEEIRNRWPETDVLMMTGDPSLDTAIPSIKAGTRDYLVKPFPPGHLAAAASRVLGMRRLERQLEAERMLRKELSAAYAELRKVERLKAALLSRVSHELRTPIAIGRLAAGLLEEEVSSAQGKDLLRRLSAAQERMLATVEDLILFARTKDETFPLKKEAVDLKALLERVVEAHRPLWQERRLAVTVSCEGEPRPVPADPELLEAAFTRLMLNAIRFNRKEGRVDVSAAFGPEEAAVSFSDTGVGVAVDEAERIFDGLYQAAEHMTREVGGLGVGLAVARRIAQAHGGEVAVRSVPGEGSVFTVRLPYSDSP